MKRDKARVDVSFQKWLELECMHGDLMLPLIIMGVLMFSALFLFWPLFILLGVWLGVALWWRWKKACENPPWYLGEGEAHGGTD